MRLHRATGWNYVLLNFLVLPWDWEWSSEYFGVSGDPGESVFLDISLLYFFLFGGGGVQTKMSWRSLLTSQYSR